MWTWILCHFWLPALHTHGQKKDPQRERVPRQKDVTVRGIKAAATSGDAESAEPGSTRTSPLFGSEEMVHVGLSPSAVWPWTNHCTTLSLGCLTCAMGRRVHTLSLLGGLNEPLWVRCPVFEGLLLREHAVCCSWIRNVAEGTSEPGSTVAGKRGHTSSVALRAVLGTARETSVLPAFQEGQSLWWEKQGAL